MRWNIAGFYTEHHNLNVQYFNNVYYEKLYIIKTEDERERMKAFPAP
jgi:hypothetical protein